MSGPMRVDWPLLKARIAAAGVEPAAACLICVTEAGRQLFVAISERLTWEATYRVGGYDYADWNELQEFVDDTIGALTMADCTEIVNSIVTQVVTQVNNHVTQAQYYTDACCYLETQPANIPPPSDSDPPGTMTERDELCIQAQIAHDNLEEFMEEVFTYIEGGGGLTAAIIALLIGGLALPLVLVAVIIGALVAVVADAITDDILDTWAAIKQDVVCAIVNASSAAEAKAEVDAIIDATGLPGIAKTLLKTLYSQAAINQIWNKELEDPGGYSADYCEPCQEWSNVAGIAFSIVTEDGNKFGGCTAFANTYNANNATLDLNVGNVYPHVFCIVETGLSGHFIGDTNVEGGFDGTPLQPWVNIGTHSGDHGPGLQSVAFGDFKLLVSTAANPTAYFWISAAIANADGYPNVADEFVVDEGSGIVGFLNIPFNGNGEFYYKPVAVTVPE